MKKLYIFLINIFLILNIFFSNISVIYTAIYRIMFYLLILPCILLCILLCMHNEVNLDDSWSADISKINVKFFMLCYIDYTMLTD